MELHRELIDHRLIVRHIDLRREPFRSEGTELECAAVELHAAGERAIDELHRAAAFELAGQRFAIRRNAERAELRHVDRELRIDRRLRDLPRVLGNARGAVG